MLGKIEGRRRSGQQRMRWLDSITDSMDVNLSTVQEIVKDREACGASVHRAAKSQTQLETEQQTTNHWRPLPHHGARLPGQSRGSHLLSSVSLVA